MTEWEVIDVFESCGLTVVESIPDGPNEAGDKRHGERDEFVVVESPNDGPSVIKPKRSSPDAEVKPDTTADGPSDEKSARDRVVFLKHAEAESETRAEARAEEVAYLNESVCLLRKEQKDCNKAIADIRKEAQNGGRKLTDDEQAEIVNIDTMLRKEIGPEILRMNNRLREIELRS